MSGGDAPSPSYLVPSPIITKRNRTPSVYVFSMYFFRNVLMIFLSITRSEKILKSKTLYGTIKQFCREKGHGFITPEDGSEDLFVHVSE